MLISTSIGIKVVHLGSKNSRNQGLESELENEMIFLYSEPLYCLEDP